MTKLASKVVDSWAMVAWVRNEPAADAVDSFFVEADRGNLRLVVSALNVGETFYILAKKKNMAIAEQFLKRLPSLSVHVAVFAIALAQAEKASVITGGDEIRRTRLVPVDWVGSQLH